MSRLSRLLAPIVRAKPAHDATELLTNGGYMNKSSAGVFSMLPLGQAVQQKIENIVRKRMVEAGGAEVSLPTLARTSIWETSGRINNTELFKLDDRYLLAPTCEEEVTKLVTENMHSPRDLPLRLFQISRKYRNELRPRGGLLRGKEFVMKDMYTFDKSQQDAHNTYKQMQSAYTKIFADIGVPVVVAEADSGSIGGSLSHEYHYLSGAGEDSVIHCDGCGYTANMERAISYGESVETGTSNAKYWISQDHSYLIAAYYPPGRTLNPILVDQVVDIDYECTNPEEVYLRQDELSRRMVRVIDPRVGVNCEIPEPPIPVSKASTTTLYEPIVEVQDGEECPSCERAGLVSSRAIEIAHTFYLGTKYTAPFKCKADGQLVEMGCFGIGISRMVAAIAEATRDAEGLKWPKSVSPFDAVLICLNEELALELLQKLNHAGINAVWDDRSNQFGALLGASRSLGFPLTIIAGKSYQRNRELEVQVRDQPKDNARSTMVPVEHLERIAELL